MTLAKVSRQCILKSLIDDLINFKIYLQSTSEAMADREKNSGRRKHQSLNIFNKRFECFERNELFRLKRIIFHNYLSTIIW